VIGIFDYLDQRSNFSKATFAAANLERLSKYGPEEINFVLLLTNSLSSDMCC